MLLSGFGIFVCLVLYLSLSHTHTHIHKGTCVPFRLLELVLRVPPPVYQPLRSAAHSPLLGVVMGPDDDREWIFAISVIPVHPEDFRPGGLGLTLPPALR